MFYLFTKILSFLPPYFIVLYHILFSETLSYIYVRYAVFPHLVFDVRPVTTDESDLVEFESIEVYRQPVYKSVTVSVV